ncbi:MAG: hypothetical protein ACK5C3_00265 [bacterium]
MQRAADIVFWLALLMWFAFAVVGGVAAMAIFPAARELPLSMTGYESFIAAAPTLGRQLVAGFLVERVFDLAQRPRIVLAAIAVAALAVQLAISQRAKSAEPLRGLRIAALVAAVASVGVSLAALEGFRAADAKYRALAADETTRSQAIDAKAEVDRTHAFASRVATAEVVSLLALAGLSAAGMGARRRA